MTLINNAAFLAAIQGATVTGVTRHYDYPPESLDTADLPAAFPIWPSANFLDMPTSCVDTGKTRSIGFIVCTEASGQATSKLKYAQFAALMDNIEAALATALSTIEYFYTYDMTTLPNYPVGDNTYWAIATTVTISAMLGG